MFASSLCEMFVKVQNVCMGVMYVYVSVISTFVLHLYADFELDTR